MILIVVSIVKKTKQEFMLGRMVRKGLSKVVTFKMRPEWNKRASSEKVWRTNAAYWNTIGLDWIEVEMNLAEKREIGDEVRVVCKDQGIIGHRRAFGFYFKSTGELQKL